MTGSLTHQFAIVLRPLRVKDGERQTEYVEARTSAQAAREATARWPALKVVSVTRVDAAAAAVKAFGARDDAGELAALEEAHRLSTLDEMRRSGT
ncbi:MAG: hypothetical protein U0325_26320 [Polyangiales bacterium]